LDLGSGCGHLIKFADKEKIDTLIQLDLSGFNFFFFSFFSKKKTTTTTLFQIIE